MTKSYIEQQNQLLIAWKQVTPTLPDGARAAGSYRREAAEACHEVCLPRGSASLNLLPEVREGAIAMFADLGIAWHDSVNGGPSNHLRDSQVQCVNALFPMVNDPGRVARAFGGVVDIAEVYAIEPGRYLTFEYIGPTDYFGEGQGRPRTRGANCTSVDAAFRYLTNTGATELALVEWKYTESYLRATPRSIDYVESRRARYGPDLLNPAGPVRGDLLDFQALLDEPIYQLVRQQLLAHRLERDHAHGATAVRVIHVLSPKNLAYQASLTGKLSRAAGDTVEEVWSRLLRRPDRFLRLDPATFADQDVTYPAYVARYADHAVGSGSAR